MNETVRDILNKFIEGKIGRDAAEAAIYAYEDRIAMRDAFAAAALQGLLAFEGRIEPVAAASGAYLHADAMLAQRDAC